jgi:hypothetical protein
MRRETNPLLDIPSLSGLNEARCAVLKNGTLTLATLSGAIHSHRIKIGSVSKFFVDGAAIRRRQAAAALLSRN